MSGIYIHIPFCRQACHYCDFHFSTSLRNKKEFLAGLKTEIALQKNYFADGVNTIYFGGGTPSVLSKDEIRDIFNELSKHFSIKADAEITLEANPEDLSREKLKELSQTPVNRLSIGIQSFSDWDLKFLNRIHSANDAIDSVVNAQAVGFKNISIDLIYGIQTLTNEQWKKNLDIAFKMNVPHISCYSLTVEPKTILDSFIRKGKIKNVDSEKSAEQFGVLMDEMQKNNFIQYEISNFCKDGFYSKHNSNYWKGVKYLGLGPAAHSYNGESRQWNVKSNAAYINSIQKNKIQFEVELLTDEQKYNEYILTSLRTIWGADIKSVEERFSSEINSHFSSSSLMAQKNNFLKRVDGKLFLTTKGKLFADKIASDLFVV